MSSLSFSQEREEIKLEVSKMGEIAWRAALRLKYPAQVLREENAFAALMVRVRSEEGESAADWLFERFMNNEISCATENLYGIGKYYWRRYLPCHYYDGNTFERYEAYRRDPLVLFDCVDEWPGVRCKYGMIGHMDVPVHVLTSDDALVRGVRNKLDGIRFDKYKSGDLSYFCGDIRFEVPHSFVDSAELVSGVFYVLSPSISKPFRYGGYSYVPHPFSSEVDHSSEEGWMLLVGDNEYRLKHRPTVEVFLNEGYYDDQEVINSCGYTGVAEVARCSAGLEMINVRPGVREHPSPMESLYKMPWSSMWDKRVIGDCSSYDIMRHYVFCLFGDYSSRVKYGNKLIFPVEVGSSTHILQVDRSAIFSSSDILCAFENWARDYDCEFVYVIGEDPCFIGWIGDSVFKGAPNSEIVCSSKLVFKMNGEYVLIKDGIKLPDNVGGKMNQGETAKECLLREIEEETSVKVSKGDLKYLTIEKITTGSTTFITNYYTLTKWVDLGKKMEVFCGEAVPWFFRVCALMSRHDVADFDRTPRQRRRWSPMGSKPFGD